MIGDEHEDNMTEREVMPSLPTSGQIIGALISRLGIRHPNLQDRTARRYFSANPERLVKDSSRAEIIEAMVEVLTDSGFIASPEERETNYHLAPVLASMLQWHADNWDLFRSFLRRRTMSVLPSHLPKVWEAYVRLAVIDLALRVAAHLHLAGSSPAALDLLGWASRTSRKAYLNQKRRQAGLSRKDVVDEIKVDDNTFDAWMYHGARPSNDNLTKIAKVLADNDEDSNAVGIALELRALYWVSDVATLLAEHIGAEAVDEAVGRLRRYAEEAYRIIDDQVPAEDRPEVLTVLADLGVGARIAEPLLAALIEQEPDDEWREDLRSTGMDWVRRVLSVNQSVRLGEVDALIEKTEGRLLKDWDVSNPEAYAHYRRSLELQVQGRLDEALAEVETAARLDPLDPANHFTLGSVKTGIGVERGDTALVNEGMDALWLTVALDPKWILPWTEIGSTLHHTGRSAEAVRHLRSAKSECGPLDSHYHSTLGAAYWKLGQLPKALAAFEAAIELDPEETSALVAASEIALWAGDHEKHRKYSRMAHHFGAEYGTDKIMEFLREFRQEELDNDGGAFEHDRKIAVMDAVIRLSPDDDYAHATRGLAHFAKGNDDLAIADMDAVLQFDPDHAAAYMLRGILYSYKNQWDRTAADMSELIRLRPEYATAYYHRGMAYGEQDLLDQAFVDSSEAIRLDPHHSDAYRVRGDCLRYKREYDKAIRDFDAALQLDPENVIALRSRGASYRMKGDPDLAIADYDATLRLRPEDLFAYRFRGDAYLAKGDYDQAIADFTSSLKTSPHDEIAYRSRGKAHLFKEQFELALADFEAAVRADPNSGVATYARGLTRQLLGDDDGAEKDFQRARELGYDDSDDRPE